MVYKCSICGYLYDEEKEGKSFYELTECPLCKQSPEKFEPVEGQSISSVLPDTERQQASVNSERPDLSYPKETRRVDSSYRYMKEIHEMAVTGQSAIEAMGTPMKMPDWDDVLILGAQLNPMPLDEHAEVSLKTVIGKHAQKPMTLDMPVYISHMSFGALSKRQRLPWQEEALRWGQLCAAVRAAFFRKRRMRHISIFLNMCPICTASLMKI